MEGELVTLHVCLQDVRELKVRKRNSMDLVHVLSGPPYDHCTAVLQHHRHTMGVYAVWYNARA